MQASHDENFVPTLLAVSSVDNTTPVTLVADPITKRLLVQNTVSSGSATPTSTPSVIGQLYVDTVAQKLYFAIGTSSSADWVIAN